MKITIESTDKVVTLNGVPARLWQGVSEKGVPCHAFIFRVGVDRAEDVAEFERDLASTTPPYPEFDVYPMRMIL